MNQKSKLILQLELVWWFFTIILLIGVLFPILKQTENFPFLRINSIFVIVFVTLTRYVFLLKHTFLAKKQLFKAVIVLTIIPFIFLLVSEINHFQTFVDEEGLEQFMLSDDLATQENLNNYIQSEMIFFGVGSVIAAIVFPFRLIISVWRNRNTGTT